MSHIRNMSNLRQGPNTALWVLICTVPIPATVHSVSLPISMINLYFDCFSNLILPFHIFKLCFILVKGRVNWSFYRFYLAYKAVFLAFQVSEPDLQESTDYGAGFQSKSHPKGVMKIKKDKKG